MSTMIVVALTALAVGVAGPFPTPAAAQAGDEEGFGYSPPTTKVDTLDAWSLEEPFELRTVSKDEVEGLTIKYTKTHQVFNKYEWVSRLPGGIDHIAAGVGTRNTGSGFINLQGAPSGTTAATAVSGFLYFGVIMDSPPPTLTVRFQGVQVTAGRIATAAQPCWNPAGTFAAYRANVLSLILPGINGVYYVDNLPSFLADGRDPWAQPDTSLPLSEGASLVVLYSHSTVPQGSFVEIHHVVQMSSSNLVVQHFLNQPITSNGALKHTRLGADGQPGLGLSHSANLTDESTFIGPIGGSPTQIRGCKSTLNTDSDWNGNDANPLNQLWDTNTLRVPGTIPNGSASYEVSYTLRGDCVVPVAHVLTAR